LKQQLDLNVDISEKIKPHQWEKLPWRWVVERTLSWLNHSRRLSKDYEISVSSAEAFDTTMNIYTHITQDMKKSEFDNFAEKLQKQRETSQPKTEADG